jgi:hypothetical protein
MNTRIDSPNALLGPDQGYPYNGPHSADGLPAHPEPAYAYQNETSYTTNAYAANTHVESGYNYGYANRQGLTGAPSTPSTYRSHFGFLKRRWSASFMAIAAIQAILCLGFEAYVFGKFQTSLGTHVGDEAVQSQYLTIPTFLALFIFGFLYILVLVWDALRLKNTIQVIGVCIANIVLMIYTSIQVDQIDEAVEVLGQFNALRAPLTSDEVWADLRPYLIALPCIIAIVSIVMAYISWRLYQEFAWDILKNIGADYRMKKRFLHYQIYIALLKFDFFFFLGFIIQFVVVVAQRSDPEFALTIATVPVTILILFAAAWFVRNENKTGHLCVLVLYFGALTYFIFKLIRIYQDGYRQFYASVQESLTAFAVITILLILLTIANAIICFRNFDAGLKHHLLAKRRIEEKPDTHSLSLHDVKPQIPSRMTID